MKRLFHNISLSNKLITLIAFSFIPLLLLIFLQIIPNVGDKFLEDKKTGLRNVVEATHGILDSYYQKAESGILTEEEAKKAAVDEINSLRYDKKEYFFMYDIDGIVRGLGSDPSKYGENRLELVDKKGNKFIKEMISVSQNEGAGYVYYYYPKLGETEPSPKLSYVKMFEPWDWFIGSGVYIDNVETALSEFKGSLYVPLFATIIGAIILILILTRTIVKPIKHLFDASLKFAEGQYDIQVEVNGEDEIGKLSGSFNQMTKNISEAVDEVKHKTQIAEQAASEAEEAKNKMEENNKYLSESTKTLLTEMDKFAKGDLTVVLQNENDDDMARLMNGFSKSVEQIKLLLVQLNNTVDKTLSTSQEISHFSNELSNGTSEQSSQTEEVASAIHEMSQTIVETAKNASGAADSAREAGDIAKTGGDIVMSTVQGMIRIEEVVSRAAKTIKHLGASSDEIGNIESVH